MNLDIELDGLSFNTKLQYLIFSISYDLNTNILLNLTQNNIVTTVLTAFKEVLFRLERQIIYNEYDLLNKKLLILNTTQDIIKMSQPIFQGSTMPNYLSNLNSTEAVNYSNKIMLILLNYNTSSIVSYSLLLYILPYFYCFNVYIYRFKS